MLIWGHPLDGRSRGNDNPQEINFFISLFFNSPGPRSFVTRPCSQLFGVRYSPHQSPIRFKALGVLPVRESSPAPGNLDCPRKLSVPRRVQGLGSQIQWLSLSGTNPIVAHGVGVHRTTASANCLCL